jgi:hypothetical protein
MTLAELKRAIQELPSDDRTVLASWLADMDHQTWDAEIARDFSPGGEGMEILDQVDAAIDRGDFQALE